MSKQFYLNVAKGILQNKIILGVSILAISLGGFTINQVYTINQYKKEVNDLQGEFIKQKIFGEDMAISLGYRPTAFLALPINNKESFSRSDYKSSIESFGQSSNYILRLESLKHPNFMKSLVGTPEDFQSLVNYLSFGIKQDLTINISGISYPCNFVHFERNFNMSSFVQVHLGFELQEQTIVDIDNYDEWTVSYNAERFGIGPIHFLYNKSDLEENPFILF